MTTFYDRVKVGVTAAPGTGDISLGAASPSFQSFSQAGVTDGTIVSYVMVDGSSAEWGHGTYHVSTTTLSRTTILGSTATNNAAINASANAVVFISLLAEDIAGFATGGGGTATATSYSYWRLRCVSVNGGTNVEIGQMLFYDASGNAIPTTGGTPFSDSDYSTAYAKTLPFDGTVPSSNHPGWASGQTTGIGYIGYQFASPVAVAKIALLCGGDGNNGVVNAPKQFVIECSNDGQAWASPYVNLMQTGWVAGTPVDILV